MTAKEKTAIQKDREDHYKEQVQMISEQLDYIQTNGVSPEDLTFRFTCQRCGFRCCMSPHTNAIIIDPYSFAYLRSIRPDDSIRDLFSYKTLRWVFDENGPLLMIDGRICPFLHIVWNESTAEEATRNLKLVEDNKDSHALIVFIAHYILMLSNLHKKATEAPEKKDEWLVFPAHQFFVLFNTVWEKVQVEHPNRLVDGMQVKLMEGIWDFFRNPPDSSTLFYTSCLLAKAQPTVCRIFPIQRYSRSKKVTRFPLPESSLDSSNNFDSSPQVYETVSQHVMLSTDLCPEQAFQQGAEKSAAHFMRDHDILDYEYSLISLMSQFMSKYSLYFDGAAEKEKQIIINHFINLLYYKPSFIPDREKFYLDLYSRLFSSCTEILTSTERSCDLLRSQGIPVDDILNS